MWRLLLKISSFIATDTLSWCLSMKRVPRSTTRSELIQHASFLWRRSRMSTTGKRVWLENGIARLQEDVPTTGTPSKTILFINSRSKDPVQRLIKSWLTWKDPNSLPLDLMSYLSLLSIQNLSMHSSLCLQDPLGQDSQSSKLTQYLLESTTSFRPLFVQVKLDHSFWLFMPIVVYLCLDLSDLLENTLFYWQNNR